MAATKRKAGASDVQSNKKASSSTLSRKPKPSVEYVEAPSHEVEEPQKTGVQRGISEKNIIETAQQSVDQAGDEGDESQRNRRTTRGLRNGRAGDHKNYDMKYHPINEVTRPKWAAQRRSGSRSVSRTHLRANDGDTSDASLPSSAKRSDVEDSDQADSNVEELPVRTSDPRAVRHSSRAEATKSVNYSGKHHPQDYALPGHQHKAERLKRAEKKRKRTSSKRQSSETKSPLLREVDKEEIVIDGANEQVDEADLDDSLQPNHPSKPRKKLRMLSDDRSTSPRMSTKGARRSQAPKRGESTKHSDHMLQTTSDREIGTLVDRLTGGLGNHQGSSEGAAQNLNGLVDDAQASSSGTLDLYSLVAAKQARPIGGVNTFASDTDGDPHDIDDHSQSQNTQHNDEGGEGDKENALTGDAGDHPTGDTSDWESIQDEDDDVAMQGDAGYDTKITFQHELEMDDTSGVAEQPQQGDANNLTQPSGCDRSGVAASREGPAMMPPRTTTALNGAPRSEVDALEEDFIHESQRLHQNSTSTLAVKATNRVRSSSSILKASARIESSSSTFKANSRANSGDKSPHPHADLREQGEKETESVLGNEKHVQPNSDRLPSRHRQSPHVLNEKTPSEEQRYFETPSSRSNPAERTGFETDAVAHGLDGHVDSLRPLSVDNHPLAARAEADQPISPLTSFADSGRSKPVADTFTQSVHKQGGPADMKPNDETAPSQVAEESSRMRLQSPDLTSDRQANLLPSSNLGQKDRSPSPSPSHERTGGKQSSTISSSPRSTWRNTIEIYEHRSQWLPLYLLADASD